MLKYVLGIIVSTQPALLVGGVRALLGSLVLHLGSILHLHVEQTLGPHWSETGSDDSK